MERGGRTVVVLLVAVGVLAALAKPAVAVAGPSVGNAMVASDALLRWTVDAHALEQQVAGITKDLVRQVRWFFRAMVSAVLDAADFWRHWLRRAAFSFAVIIIAALADSGLLTTWRAEGLRTLLTYSTLMLYVYGRLLFSSGVNIAPKLLLAGAVAYGIFRRDLVPDRTLIPGRVDDAVLLVVATRAFVYACPDELVREYAGRAVSFKRRLLSLQRYRR